MKRTVLGLTLAISLGLAPNGAQAADSATLQAGINNYNQGFIQKALPLFEKAAATSPRSEQAFLWLARAYQKQGGTVNFERAQTSYAKVLDLNPRNVEALSALGEMWSWDVGRRAEGVALLKRAIDLKPGDPLIAKKLSEALLWQGDAVHALQYAAPIANRFSSDPKWVGEYAQMLARTNHGDQAVSLYETRLGAQNTKDLRLKLDYAMALAKAGQTARAQAVFNDTAKQAQGTSLSKDAGFASAMSGLAFDLQLYPESLRWDQSLPASMQRQKDIQLRQARALSKAFRVPEAVEKFHRLYEANLLSANEKLEYAEYLRTLQLDPAAMPAPDIIDTLYAEVLRDAPNNPDVALRLARYSAEDESKFDQTVQFYRLALAGSGNNPAVEREFLDAMKASKTHAVQAEAIFKQTLAEHPDDAVAQEAYAEFLSWQPSRRPEAMRLYVALAKSDTAARDRLEAKMEEVLRWEKPTTALIPVYQDIANLYPANKTLWLTVARAYRSNPDYFKEALDTYGTLVKRYPDDATVKKEWLNLLVSNERDRGQVVAMLEKMARETPNDLDVQATYAKLLSYDHQYGKAMRIFEGVLEKNPRHREALLGKGYVILWSGRKLEAKAYFSDLRKKYPDDVDIALGLAQSEKLIGRYDEAMRIIEQIKPLMQLHPPESTLYRIHAPVATADDASAYLLVANETDVMVDPLLAQAVPDYTIAPAPSAELQSMQSQLEDLNQALESLKQVQAVSGQQLDRMNQALETHRDTVQGNETVLQTDEPVAGSAAAGQTATTMGTDAMVPSYGVYSALDYDTNPLLSGLGRFKNDQLGDLERSLSNDLRPMIRAGFQYATQQGEATTSRFRYYGFPNQVSFSLTPQIRLRGGVVPTNYAVPDGVSPDSTWGTAYNLGATVKYWDRLTLDGDVSIEHFSQSNSSNVNYHAQAEYAINDSIRVKLGSRRIPQFNSLLSVAGLKPSQGAFAGDVLGQSRETSIFAELNTNPFNQHWDWNLGYEWARVTGRNIPDNSKNQAFTSLGYTWNMGANHRLRLGYEFLYFGYDKNATNGFFDTTTRGVTRPVVSLSPVTLANSGYVFGGYYSPESFFMNAARLDLRGSLFNKFIEYKLGGSLGVQNFKLGHGIDRREPSGSSLATSFDANVIMNFTDWLALYSDIDYLDAGGQFNRWRFGGGLIVRPNIKAVSPLIGGH